MSLKGIKAETKTQYFWNEKQNPFLGFPWAAELLAHFVMGFSPQQS